MLPIILNMFSKVRLEIDFEFYENIYILVASFGKTTVSISFSNKFQ